MNQNRNALVTGATSGIGYELSRLLASNGFNLVLVARNQKRLEEVQQELSLDFSINTEIIPKDLALPSAPKEIFNELQQKSIHIDILVNNAGFNEYGPFSATDMAKEIQMLQVNIASLTSLTKLFLPGMMAQHYGKILNLGSTGSFAPGPLNAVYCATKAYVLSFSEAIAEELQGTGVTVTVLCPGATRTEFAQRAQMEDVKIFQGRVMSAKRVAEIGYNALMMGNITMVAGWSNQLTMLSLRLIPRIMVARISKRMMMRK